MQRFFYLDTSSIIASIMNTKNKHYQENFVTLKEINITKSLLQKKFNEKGLKIIITDEVDSHFFKLIDGIFIKNDDVTLYNLTNRYQGLCYSIECFMILWNDDLIFEILEKIKYNVFEEATSLEIIINKILKDQKVFYENVAHELSQEEYEYIKRKIEKKDCTNCSNNCEDNLEKCSRWDNPELIGRTKVLRTH